MFARGPADPLHFVEDADRGLVMDDAHGADAGVLGERGPDLGGRDRLGKAGTKTVHLESIGGRDLNHAIAEEPVTGDQHLVARRKHACDAHFDPGHARPEDQVDIARRLENLAHARRRVLVQSGPVVSVMRADGKRRRPLNGAAISGSTLSRWSPIGARTTARDQGSWVQLLTEPNRRLIGRPTTELMVASTWSRISSSISPEGSASPAAKPETTILSPPWWTDCSMTKPGIRSVKQPEPMACLIRARSEYCTTSLVALP